MFGYIRISKPELRVKEYEMYKAVYCTLCKKLGKDYGFLTRFALNYDFTFTALLELSLKDGFDDTYRKSCVCNPFKKCNYCKNEEPFALSSAAVVILSYYKLLDDIADEKGFKKFTAFALSKLFSNAFKKAKKKYPEVEKMAALYVEEQSKAEENPNCSLDEAANPSSNMLSRLLSMCAQGSDKEVLSHLGMLLGRYIYLMDCLADRERDIKKNSFNPIKNISEDEVKEKIKGQIYIIINQAEKTFELLNVKRFKNILGNIIYVGLEDTMLSEIKRLEKKK